jgi:hypothetical protein
MNRVDELRGQAEQVYNQIEDTPDALTQRLNAIAERVDSEGFQWGPDVDENQFDMAVATEKTFPQVYQELSGNGQRSVDLTQMKKALGWSTQQLHDYIRQNRDTMQLNEVDRTILTPEEKLDSYNDNGRPVDTVSHVRQEVKNAKSKKATGGMLGGRPYVRNDTPSRLVRESESAMGEPGYTGDERYQRVLEKVESTGVKGIEAQMAATSIRNATAFFSKRSGLSEDEIWNTLGLEDLRREDLQADGRQVAGRLVLGREGGRDTILLDTTLRTPIALTHEISHWITECSRKLARDHPDNARLRKDWQTIKEYVTGSNKHDMDSPNYYKLTRDQHENMANGLLAYFKDGTAPNKKIASFFQRVRVFMTGLWNSVPNKFRVELTPAIQHFFHEVVAGDVDFDYLYGGADDAVDLDLSAVAERAGNIAALEPDTLKLPQAAIEEVKAKMAAPQQQTASPREQPKGFTLTESTKGNVTTVTKRVDRSDTVGILGEALHSPNIIAKYFPKFAPVFELARAARRTQDKLRTQWNHSIDKAFGGVGLFGQRKGGYAATKAQREELNELLYLGDFYGKTFTAEELRAEGYSDGAIKGYQHIRNVDAGILRRVNEHRKSVGLEAIVGLEGHMMHVFHSFRVYDSNGVHIQSFQTMKEASAFADTLASDARHITIKPVINDFSGQAQKDAVTVGDNQYQIIMNKLADVFALSAEDAREFGKGVIKRANKARFYGPAQQRTGFSGWSSDMEYAIRHQANLSARYIAMDTLKRNGRKYFEKAFGKFGNEYKGIAKYTKDYLNDVLGVPSKWEDAQNKMLERYAPILARLSDRYADRPAVMLGNAVSGLTASMKLGFLNLGSAILNMSALNGVGAATSYAQAVQAGAEYLRPTLTTRKLYAALGIDSDITMESASTYSGAKMSRKILSGVSTGAFQFFDGAARKIAAIAGYRDGLAKGMNERQAIDHAREIVDKTNFNYGVEDSPNIFRRSGPLGNVMLQFKKYPIKIMELGVNHLEGAQKAKFWAGQLVMSGLFGLPFTAVLKAVVKALFDDEDIEAEVKSLVASLGLPEPVARTLNYGIAANIGIDLGQRVGMGDIVPTRAQDFVGPGVGTIVDIVKSTTDWAQGETALVDEIGKLIPGIGNPMKAIFGGAADSYNPERNRDTYRTTGERLLQMTGLRPIGTSVRRDAIMIQREQQRDEQHAKQVAIDRYMDDPSPENRAELQRLKVNPAQVVRRKKMQPGDDYDRALRGARKREDRDALTGYVGALGVDQ